MDVGLYPVNYFDYENDNIAIQKEKDLIDDILNTDELYQDIDFPKDGRSLYYDQFNPPKGSMPGESIKWYRICNPGEIDQCLLPDYCFNDKKSSIIEQGACGNSYFINSLRLLANDSIYINRLIVSKAFAHKGIYTFKFFKYGKWRYVIIDDYIPCCPSGKVYYSRNLNPNETFAMLIEKAYAKLHGNYEALSYGLINQSLSDLTPGAHIKTLRNELLSPNILCDQVWDFIENGITNQRIIGCIRHVPDSYIENPTIRQGVSTGIIYQIIDACITTAQPSTDLDGITIGMICIKNLQKDKGRYTGNWSFNHDYWSMYPDIGHDLRYRTRSIQYNRGLGLKPNEYDDTNYSVDPNTLSDGNLYDNQLDDLNLQTLSKPNKIVQPSAEDLHWIQIEDFVDIFNRVYVINDDSFKPNFKSKRLISKWIPGDLINGSTGPPIYNDNLIAIQTNHKTNRLLNKPFYMGPVMNSEYSNRLKTFSQSNRQFHGGISILDKQINKQLDKELDNEKASIILNSNIDDDELLIKGIELEQDSIASNSISPSINPLNSHVDEYIDMLEEQKSSIDISTSLTINPSNELMNYQSNYQSNENIDKDIDINKLNKQFINNPCHSFIINEETSVNITLYQLDKRWSYIYQSNNSFNNKSIHNNLNNFHKERLSISMTYSYAIGFLLVNLQDQRTRPSLPFTLDYIVGSSDYIEYLNISSCYIRLKPGRYGVIPYTHIPLSTSMDYVIHFHYMNNEFELEEIVKLNKSKRYQSSSLSQISSDHDSDLDSDSDNDNQSSTIQSIITKITSNQSIYLPPLILTIYPWEYIEEYEEKGILTMYNEIGTVAKYIYNMRNEIHDMKKAISQINDMLDRNNNTINDEIKNKAINKTKVKKNKIVS